MIGCPAEEILWGKVALLDRGAFAGCDVLLTSHGDYQNGAVSRPCQAVVSGEFVFVGAAGHGGLAGRPNALDAAEAAIRAIADDQSTAFPDVILKHVVRRGGVMPGITPDEARVWYTARSLDMQHSRGAYDRLRGKCESAAGGGIAVRHQFIAETRGYLPNDVLGRVLQDALEEVGPPAWNEDDLDFMAELAQACTGRPGLTLDRSLALHAGGHDPYGQDDGEASWRIPLGRVNWAYPEEVPIHHWGWTALSGHRASDAGPLMASEALAMAACALLERPALVEEARTELTGRTRGHVVDPPRLGAWRTMTEDPRSFWDATWAEAAPPS